jgi:periplasmic divalent cation tolerance protein
MTGFISVYMTAPTAAEAETIARALVEEKLAACVNIIPGLRSIYRWEGKLVEENEVALIAKSRAELFEALSVRVKALHSYSCPCIVATPLSAGYPPYLDWLAGETKA